jgi:hypothetical protein
MIMNNTKKHRWMTVGMLAVSVLVAPIAKANVITDWNVKANAICVAAKLPPPLAFRMMAMVQTAVYEALNAITKRYPPGHVKLDATAGASVDAAVAAANHAMLLKLLPSQQAAIEGDYQSALSAIPDDPAKTAGIVVGEQASAAILAWRADDGAAVAETYRPRTAPGVYVPTVIPAAPQWLQRKPWVMASANQFRPGPPPSLTSDLWARDYNEIKALGSKNSTRRSAEPTEIARCWQATGPGIYFPMVRSVAEVPGRELTQNARLFAVAGQAMDDALMAVFDAKYHYEFWRPVTAIRNGDMDGNEATERDASWLPFIDTPMHPEYPCAHCILAAAIGAVLYAEIGSGPTPPLRTASVTASGAVRRWTKIDDMVQEVAKARIYDGVHYRTSTEVGTAMGQKIGALAATKYPQQLK